MQSQARIPSSYFHYDEIAFKKAKELYPKYIPIKGQGPSCRGVPGQLESPDLFNIA